MSPNLPELNVHKCIESKVETNEYNNNSPAIVDRNIHQIVERSDITKKDSDELVYKRKIDWTAVIAFTYLHTAAVYGLFLAFYSAKANTNYFTYAYAILGGFGATAGSHRLWSHRTYKAKFQLRLILMIFQCFTFQNSIYIWVRDHRCHHKFTDSHGDPHNTTRGFFFAHIGWLMLNKHPEVKEKGKGVDLSDLERDPIVVFQRKYYYVLMPIFCFIIPTLIPVYLWGEDLSTAFHVAAIFRLTYTLNTVWFVNSIAHGIGMKPYDKNITPTENLFVAIASFGEGFHNYHHAFPWDYKTGEFGGYALNLTTAFIDMCAWLGWAYDLKTASPELIKKRVSRSGDGSHIHSGHKAGEFFDEQMWGYDDHLKEDEKKLIQILHKIEQ